MEHRLEPLQSVEFTINAIDRYSSDHVLINSVEVYKFYCDPQQTWKDWFIKTNADGFFNPFASVVGGSYNNDEQKLFKVGASATLTMDIVLDTFHCSRMTHSIIMGTTKVH